MDGSSFSLSLARREEGSVNAKWPAAEGATVTVPIKIRVMGKNARNDGLPATHSRSDRNMEKPREGGNDQFQQNVLCKMTQPS
ncbi:hypothetical protein BSKO_13297 [Bryopsis sp. KO-2023]|nr:hypothetical protein BSKO_13297 [Bryopsis sp. KO-2023]